jgi:hypothetical protein
MIEPDDLLPAGLEDSLPAQAAAEMRAMRSVMDVLHSHGYDRVRPPLIEFERSLAGRMDGVSPQRMFRFVILRVSAHWPARRHHAADRPDRGNQPGWKGTPNAPCATPGTLR